METVTVLVDKDLEPIIPRYFELHRRELKDLARAVTVGDAESVRLIGHKMKGTGSSYGFPYLSELGAGIELAGRAEDMAEAERLGDVARDYLESVRVVYTEGTTP